MRFAFRFMLMALLACVACGKHHAASADHDAATSAAPAADGGVDASGSLPACHWSDAFNAKDGAIGGCVAGRTFVSCKGGAVGGACLTDGAAECPDGNGGVLYGCVSECTSDEYALACTSTPPPTCRTNNWYTPGGLAFYCCPCDR